MTPRYRTRTPDPASFADIAAFVTALSGGVVATVDDAGAPEAAYVGLVGLADGRMVFDAPVDSRKIHNLSARPRVAVVVGGDPVTVQVEGEARIVDGAEREAAGRAYAARFPRSRALDDGFVLVAIRPSWLRVYDTGVTPPAVTEAWR